MVALSHGAWSAAGASCTHSAEAETSIDTGVAQAGITSAAHQSIGAATGSAIAPTRQTAEDARYCSVRHPLEMDTASAVDIE